MASRVLFGLGNPGKAYAATRHNAGWQVLDVLAERQGAQFRRVRWFHAETADLTLGELRLRLVKPQSFMNLVGPVLRQVLDQYEVSAEQALVLVDDFMLPFGRLRLRPGGSSGGHNGLKSIEAALGHTNYPRLRLGIGPAPAGATWADYVLKRYDAAQRRALPELLERSADASEFWAREGLDPAMNRFNAGPDA